MNPVVVHGGGPQIEEALGKLGKGTFIQGMRTDEETMKSSGCWPARQQDTWA